MEGQARKRDSIGNTMSSRQPFRNIKQSPWKRSNGMNEKTLTDNLRVLVKPTTLRHTQEQNTSGARLMSPLRTLKPHLNGSCMSPWRNRNEEEIDGAPKMKLHESEVSIFQQLCLDKYDENAAIEILLDSTENSIPDVYTESSESTDHGSNSLPRRKAGSVEGKKKFFDRFFFKSERKSPMESVSSSDFLGSSKESINSMSHSSKTSDEPNIPTPPSSIPRTRITVENTFTETSKIAWTASNVISNAENNVERTRSILDDFHQGGDTISNISSLSGTRASSLVTPVDFNRHESLGFESIKDIRKCLKEMERQLGQANHTGQRVSRQKVMRALFTVADSLEDDEEKSHLKKELITSIEAKRDEVMQPAPSKPLKQDSSDDEKSELTTSDDEDFTLESSTLDEIDEDTVENESPFNIVSSVGNFFGVDSQNQHAVEEVLDDLLWTEFVSSRQRNTNRKKSNGANSRPNTHSDRSRKSSVLVKKYKGSHTKRDRSWWRNQPSKEEDGDDDDEYSSSSSEDEFKSYLPTSITVKNRYKKPTTLEDAFPRSVSNPRYRVELVDTESRLGFEMDHTSRRSPVL